MRVFHVAALGLGVAWIVAPLTARDRDDGDRDRGRPRVIVYEHADFRGASLALDPGESLVDLSRRRFPNGAGMNDSISSIRIEGDIDVLVFQDAGFRGGMMRITHSMRNLHDEARGWNDAISSIRLEGGRRGPPPRPDFSRYDPVIRRVYVEILLREPDDSGLRLYRGRMMDDSWSEVRVRDELRRSSEYRVVVDRVVTRVHRDLLGRDPDPSARRTYCDRMLRDGWSEEDVRNAIRKGDEYRHRPHPPGH